MKKYLAESIGTFTLVLFGCGAAVIAGASVGVLGSPLYFTSSWTLNADQLFWVVRP